MHKPTGPRPDVFDSMVTLWLSGAVCAASLMTAPLNAYRAPWPTPRDPAKADDDAATDAGDAECQCGPPIVSNIRPEDVGATVVAEPGTTETCRDCRFFAGVTSMAGECRRYPPAMGESPRAEWPITEARAWCGMHLPAFVPVH